MRADLLAISPASSRYSGLHKLELRGCGVPIGPRLWRVHQDDFLADAASVEDLLRPVLRAPTIGGLLEELSSGRYALEEDEATPWTLRYEEHGRPGDKAPARAHECPREGDD